MFVYKLSGVVGSSPVAVMSKRNIPVKEDDMFYNLLHSILSTLTPITVIDFLVRLNSKFDE